MQLVGRFLGATMRYDPIPGVSINWRKGLPPDVPVCGFVGELCLVGMIGVVLSLSVV